MDKNVLKDLQLPKNVVYEKNIDNRFKGKFIITPLEKGFGITIGNSLRRVLYSSIRGYAVTYIRIEWEDREGNRKVIVSEFDNIPFVVEDTIDIFMNLKMLRLRLMGDELKKSFSFEVEGPKTVYGKDFEVSSDLEVVSKELKLFTLQEGKLYIDFTVENGKGYSPAEKRHDEGDTLGMLPVDAIFSPIKKVNIKVEPARVGNVTDYEKLIIELETDGTKDLTDVIESAAYILIKNFMIFIESVIPREIEEDKKEEEEEIEEEDKKLLSYLDQSLDTLEFTERVKNCFKAANINTFRDLLTKSESELSTLRNFGRKSLEEVRVKLKGLGFKIGMKEKIEEIEKNKR